MWPQACPSSLFIFSFSFYTFAFGEPERSFEVCSELNYSLNYEQRFSLPTILTHSEENTNSGGWFNSNLSLHADSNYFPQSSAIEEKAWAVCCYKSRLSGMARNWDGADWPSLMLIALHLWFYFFTWCFLEHFISATATKSFHFRTAQLFSFVGTEWDTSAEFVEWKLRVLEVIYWDKKRSCLSTSWSCLSTQCIGWYMWVSDGFVHSVLIMPSRPIFFPTSVRQNSNLPP